MLRGLKKIALPFFAAWTVICWVLDFYGRLQGAKDFFDNRGMFMKCIGLILTSQWLPIGLFVAAVGLLAIIHFNLFRCKKGAGDRVKPLIPQPPRLRMSCHPDIEG